MHTLGLTAPVGAEGSDVSGNWLLQLPVTDQGMFSDLLSFGIVTVSQVGPDASGLKLTYNSPAVEGSGSGGRSSGATGATGGCTDSLGVEVTCTQMKHTPNIFYDIL